MLVNSDIDSIAVATMGRVRVVNVRVVNVRVVNVLGRGGILSFRGLILSICCRCG